jgi:hypothetical protein
MLFILSVAGGNAFDDPGLTKIADNVCAFVDVKNAGLRNSFAANAGIIYHYTSVDTLRNNGRPLI